MLNVKQCGIQRSGTNYLRKLLLDNVVEVTIYENKYGWKHGPPLDKEKLKIWAEKRQLKVLDSADKVHPIIIIIKNPYSWYQSIKKWRKEKFNFEKEYKKYNKLYKLYKKLYEEGHEIFDDAYIIRYEDLLRSPKKEVEKIVDVLGGQLKPKFVNASKVNLSPKFDEKRRNFYLKSKNFELSPELIKKITDVLDWDLMNFYGYKRI